ncbi:MAG: hypothetical protein M1838_004315 [Thelocarpon superellum]|nr:MAG: hypothetical protein M1838_004315 [Thelocarpon superellum]
MSLRVVPSKAHGTSRSNTSAGLSSGAPSAPGLPDTLREAAGATSPDHAHLTRSSHPLEPRLQKWAATQEALKMESLRRTFGMAEPIRRGMELRICETGEWRPSALGGTSGVHGDILRGREADMAWEDVWRGDETRVAPDFHSEMEARLKMSW